MKTSIGIIRWSARILCILAILFVSMFALDSFGPGLSIWKQLGGFLMHLIPSFILIIFLVVAWKRELIGGIMFVILGAGLVPFIYMMNHNMNHSVWMSLGVILMINFPFILAGSLFILANLLEKKETN